MAKATREGARSLIVCVTGAAVAMCIAQGASQLIAAAMFDGRVAMSPLARVTPPGSAMTDGCSLIEGDQFFDSALHLRCDGVVDPAEPPVGQGTPAACSGSLRLVGAYVRRGDPSQSFAAITDATGASLLYREGMSVQGRGVASIAASSVELTQDGVVCTLPMFEARSVDEHGPMLAGLGDVVVTTSHVRRISDTSYEIDRSFVDEMLATRAIPRAHVVPEEVDGRVVGVRIFGATRGSLLADLGIQNGDSLRTINGYDMTDPSAALEAYVALQHAEHLTAQLVRRGQPLTLEYTIQ